MWTETEKVHRRRRPVVAQAAWADSQSTIRSCLCGTVRVGRGAGSLLLLLVAEPCIGNESALA